MASLPETMLAVQYKEQSTSGLETVALPVIGDNDVLIEVHSAGLNFAEVMAKKGLYPDAPPRPFVPGYEVAGIVRKLGPKAAAHQKLSVNDRVFALTVFGGYAQFAVASYEAVFGLPDKLSFAEGASLPVQLGTAYHGLVFTGLLGPGSKVLIQAAAGGVGQLAVQIAKNAGAEVFATASSDEKLALLKEKYGVDHIINYATHNVTDEVRRITGVSDAKKGALDIILDSVGGKQLHDGIALLRPNGRIVSIGAASIIGNTPFEFKVDPVALLFASKTFVGLNLYQIVTNDLPLFRKSIEAGLDLIAQGKLKTVITQEFDLADYDKAQIDMENRKTTGKIVFRVSHAKTA